MISVLVRISRHNVRRRRSPQFEAPASSVPGNWQTFASGGIGHTSLPLDRQPLGPRRGCVAWVPTCSYADLLSASLFPSYRCTIGGWPTPELRVVAILAFQAFKATHLPLQSLLQKQVFARVHLRLAEIGGVAPDVQPQHLRPSLPTP
ncbi:hypothetical protein VDGL01_04346 [Verticillium dahliae]